MHYMMLFLAFLACNTGTKTPELTQDSAINVAITSTDSIVPPQYDRDGKLIPVVKSEAEWKKELSEQEYKILRQEGTERSCSGELLLNKEQGTYACRGCGLPLFTSDTKFESGTGWPSFWQPVKPEFIAEIEDRSYGMVRIEAQCARCGGHLGHVFDDGPNPTGLRYCINSVSLRFVQK